MSGDNIRNSSVVRRLQRFVDEYDSQRAAAKALGNKNYQSSISKALAGERMPSKAVRKALDEYETRHRMEQPEPADAPPDSQDTVLFSVPMRLARETKNTYFYDAIHDDAAMKSSYIQRSEIGSDPPEVIEVSVKALDEYEPEHNMEQPEPAEAPPDSQDTVLFSVIMRLARDTKNTHLYNAINDNVVMKSAYIQKSEIGADPPEFIEVAVTLTTTCDK